jgi:hypothetical protein
LVSGGFGGVTSLPCELVFVGVGERLEGDAVTLRSGLGSTRVEDTRPRVDTLLLTVGTTFGKDALSFLDGGIVITSFFLSFRIESAPVQGEDLILEEEGGDETAGKKGHCVIK